LKNFKGKNIFAVHNFGENFQCFKGATQFLELEILGEQKFRGTKGASAPLMKT